jgi:hypothetical protein
MRGVGPRGIRGELMWVPSASSLFVFLLPAILRYRCPKKEPRVPLRSSGQAKRAGNPPAYGGTPRVIAGPAHNNHNYWRLVSLWIQSFLDTAIFTTGCLIHADGTRAMRRYCRRWIADIWLRLLKLILIEYRQWGAGRVLNSKCFCVSF